MATQYPNSLSGLKGRKAKVEQKESSSEYDQSSAVDSDDEVESKLSIDVEEPEAKISTTSEPTSTIDDSANNAIPEMITYLNEEDGKEVDLVPIIPDFENIEASDVETSPSQSRNSTEVSEKRKERNRLAAQRCRQKKVDKIKELTQLKMELEEEQRMIQSKTEKMISEMKKYRALLMKCQSPHCQNKVKKLQALKRTQHTYTPAGYPPALSSTPVSSPDMPVPFTDYHTTSLPKSSCT